MKPAVNTKTRAERLREANRNAMRSHLRRLLGVFLAVTLFIGALTSAFVYLLMRAGDPEVGYLNANIDNWPIVAVFALVGGVAAVVRELFSIDYRHNPAYMVIGRLSRFIARWQ